MYHRGIARATVKQASKYAGGTTVQTITRVDAVAMQLLLNKLEQLGVDDGVVFAFVDFIAVGDFAQVDPISQQRMKCVLVERNAADRFAGLGHPQLGPPSKFRDRVYRRNQTFVFE